MRLRNLGSVPDDSRRSVRWVVMLSRGADERRVEFSTPCDERGVGPPWLVLMQRLTGLRPLSDDVRLPPEDGAPPSRYGGTLVFGGPGAGQLIVRHDVTGQAQVQITTAAGTFEATRLDWTNEASTAGVEARYSGSSWLAPGVGLLRIEERSVAGPTYSLELESVELAS